MLYFLAFFHTTFNLQLQKNRKNRLVSLGEFISSMNHSFDWGAFPKNNQHEVALKANKLRAHATLVGLICSGTNYNSENLSYDGRDFLMFVKL